MYKLQQPTSPHPGRRFRRPSAGPRTQVRNITSALYDLRPEGDQQGVNIALVPNALRVMDMVGVYDSIRTLGYNYEYLTSPMPKASS